MFTPTKDGKISYNPAGFPKPDADYNFVRPNFEGIRPEFREQRMLSMAESCMFKATMATVGGAAMGAVFGIFMSSMAGSSFETPVAVREMSTREQMRHMWKDTKTKSRYFGKQFAVIGGLYTISQCAMAKWQASESVTTHVGAGCATGAMLGVKGGLGSMCMGCAGFAAFSAVMETYMPNLFG